MSDYRTAEGGSGSFSGLPRPLSGRRRGAGLGRLAATEGRRRLLLLDVGLFGNLQGILDLNSEVSDGTFQFRVPE